MAEGFEPLQSDEDIEEILRLAVRHSGVDGGSLRERLNASALELGVSPEVLAEAEREWIETRQGRIDLETEVHLRKQFRKLRVAEFFQHLFAYIAINGFLAWIDYKDNQHFDWVIWPVMSWGIAVFIHFGTILVHGKDAERDFQRWLRKRNKVRN